MMNELKRWGDEKPDVGRPFVLYRSKKWGGTWCRRDFVQGQASTFTFTTEDTGVACVWPPTQPSDRWCYVPSAPDWDRL